MTCPDRLSVICIRVAFAFAVLVYPVTLIAVFS